MPKTPNGHERAGVVGTGGAASAVRPAIGGPEHRSARADADASQPPLVVTWAALALIAVGWGVVAWLALTRWRDPDVTLFALLAWLVAVLAGVAIINIARLALQLGRLELVPAVHRLWHRYWLWLWIPPLVFIGAVVLGTNL